MNLEVPGAILPLGWAILSTRAKTVSWYNPLRRTRVKLKASVSFLRLIRSAMFGETFNLVTRVGLP